MNVHQPPKANSTLISQSNNEDSNNMAYTEGKKVEQATTERSSAKLLREKTSLPNEYTISKSYGPTDFQSNNEDCNMTDVIQATYEPLTRLLRRKALTLRQSTAQDYRKKKGRKG